MTTDVPNILHPLLATIVAHVRGARADLANASITECVIRWHRANVIRETWRENQKTAPDNARIARIRQREFDECVKNLLLPGTDLSDEQARQSAVFVTCTPAEFAQHFTLPPSQRQQEMFADGGAR